jgi:hypothetical protein
MVPASLLLSIGLVFLPVLCLGQESLKTSAVRETCPVTKPAMQPFVPPPPYPAKLSRGQFWFGTDRLWTALPETGAWIGLGHYTPSDPTFRQKLPFWRQGLDAHIASEAKLTVSGRRTDSLAPPLQTDGPGTPSWTADDEFFMTGINFPTTGCWEITGRYEDVTLTFVVWIGQP